MSLPRSDAVRTGDDLRSGIVKLARDPLLRRSSHQPVRPARSQVGEHFGGAVSDREWPGFTALSGTQRPRADVRHAW